jgi:hypothetical protein
MACSTQILCTNTTHTLAEAMLTDWFRAPGREVERVETFGPRAGAYEQVYRLTHVRREAACVHALPSVYTDSLETVLHAALQDRVLVKL